MDFDDFPVSPERTVNPMEYLQAYIEASRIFSQVGQRDQPRSDRALMDLAHQIYSRDMSAEPLFRAHRDASVAGAVVWLSKVRSIAHWAVVGGVARDFNGLDMEFLRSIPRTSSSLDGIRGLERLLLDKGVILIHENATPGTKVDGCVFRLPTGHVVIGMTLRYARLDHYYFTLMHELGHVVLHLGELDRPIIDDLDDVDLDGDGDGQDIELEANRFARDLLIPRNEWRTSEARLSLRTEDVQNFAQRLGIAPQIVAGRIRNERKRHDLFSAIVHQLDVREILANA